MRRVSAVSSPALKVNGEIVVGTSRYYASGSLDNSFGISRRAPSLASGTARPQSDGKIVVIGSVTSKVELEQFPNLIPVTGFALTRYDSNGSIDSSFGERGGVITDSAHLRPLLLPPTW